MAQDNKPTQCNTHDISGRAYAKLSITKPGDWLEADSGFECIGATNRKLVKQDINGLYVECAKGEHYLDGQIDEDGETIIGFYPVPAVPHA